LDPRVPLDLGLDFALANFSKRIHAGQTHQLPPSQYTMSIKQLIISAIIKVSEENPLLNHEDTKTAIESRDQFIQLLMNELFPEAELESTHITVPVVPAPVATEVPAPTPAPVAAPVDPPTPTKKRGPMTEEAKAAMKAKKAANAAKKVEPVPVEAPVVVEAPAKEKKPRAKKAAVPENANLVKIDPTWRKHLKAADKEHAKELEPQLLEYVNSLTNEDFHAKTTEAHVADFVASRSDGKVEAEVTEVEFNGKTYYVNPETKRVYEGEGVYNESTQEWTNMKPVGYVGMAAFTEMKME